jgi:putative ABC transport system substrate-binding protein
MAFGCRMHRRSLLLAALPALLPAAAQAAPKRLVVLAAGSPDQSFSRETLALMRQGLASQGLHEGTDLVLEMRWAAGDYGSFASAARELARSRPDVVVVQTITAAAAMRDLAPAVPTVMLHINDPVAVGLVPSLARPGGNLTGTATHTADILDKTLDLLARLRPGLAEVAVVFNPDNPSNQRMVAQAEAPLRALGIGLRPWPWGAGGLAAVHAALRATPPGALLVIPDAALLDHAPALAALGPELGLPVASMIRVFPENGALFSYGFPRAPMVLRTMYFVRRVLEGARPADLPIEQPTGYELVLNARVARQLGITLPLDLLAQAEAVIE